MDGGGHHRVDVVWRGWQWLYGEDGGGHTKRMVAIYMSMLSLAVCSVGRWCEQVFNTRCVDAC